MSPGQRLDGRSGFLAVVLAKTTDFEVLKVGAEAWGVIWLMMSPTGGCLPSMCLLSSG